MSRKPAVIFDRDGTLASVTWCAPRDRHDSEEWRRFNGMIAFDPVVPEVAALLRSIRPGVTRIMTSGRMRGDRPGDYSRQIVMRHWLKKHHLPIDHLFMRADGDTRVDSEVKREMYERLIRPIFDVRVVIDDRPQVCDMWRSFGLHVVQVTDPGLEPDLTRGAMR